MLRSFRRSLVTGLLRALVAIGVPLALLPAAHA